MKAKNRMKGAKMNSMKVTTKYQLIRDGELYNTVYDKKYEAEAIGRELVDCKLISHFEVKPIKAAWLKGGK